MIRTIEHLEISDGHAQLSHYITSRAWWVIVPLDETGAAWVQAFEREFYYSKGFEDDFHALLIPGAAGRLLLPLYFARKTRAPRAEVETFLKHPVPAGQDLFLWGQSLESADAIMTFLQSTVKAVAKA